MLDLKDREFFQDLSDDDGSKLSGGLEPCKWIKEYDQIEQEVKYREWCQVPAEGGGMEWRKSGRFWSGEFMYGRWEL